MDLSFSVTVIQVTLPRFVADEQIFLKAKKKKFFLLDDESYSVRS